MKADPPGRVDPDAPFLRKPTAWSSKQTNAIARIEEARKAKLDTVKELFGAAQVSFPPTAMMLRVFKRESTLELWAAGAPADALTKVATYGICAASGTLGPKRREGDAQVPEGFYTINLYNPASKFHLAMHVSYPNLSDRILGDKRKPGSEIMIHGNCVSAGCMAMTDERIQEIWLAATALRDARGTVHVHIFPSRDIRSIMSEPEHSSQRPFWQNLLEGFDYFEQTRKLPVVTIDREGRYHFR